MNMNTFLMLNFLVIAVILYSSTDHGALSQRAGRQRNRHSNWWSYRRRGRSCPDCFCGMCSNARPTDEQLDLIYKGIFFSKEQIKSVKSWILKRQTLYILQPIHKVHRVVPYHPIWKLGRGYVVANPERGRYKRETDMTTTAASIGSTLGIVGDGDSCCPSFQTFVDTSTTTTLKNTNNVDRSLVNLKNLPNGPKHQLISRGTCGRTSQGQSCQGGCRQETRVMTLLVYDNTATTGASFDLFEVNAYCSCKNVVQTVTGK